MLEIEFKTLTDRSLESELLAMMEGLYREDPAAVHPDVSRFPTTIAHFLSEPSRGRIVLFMEGAAALGYAIVIPFWSNEFGGTVLMIDEVFVRRDARGQRIGRRFFDFVMRERPFDAVAAMLEVSPANERARGLYESIGFHARPYEHLVWVFANAGLIGN